MPEIVSVSKIDFDHKIPQEELKKFAKKIFADRFDDIERLLRVFENAKIDFRNMCVPLEYFYESKSLGEKNDLYIKYATKFSIEAIEKCLENSGVNKNEVTDIIFVSTTGLSTPSIDALIINEMRLSENINRLPVWGLGCAGGAAGIAKASVIAKANPKAVVILVALELCSLTFIRDDLSKSNFVATSIFADGASAVLITGDNVTNKKNTKLKLKILDSQSKIYYNSLDVMGWDILDDGFKVVFSKDIPTIVDQNVKKDIVNFLEKNDLTLDRIKNFVTHPGGTKVINAYINALGISPRFFKNTFEVLRDYGNMSSASVFYVLDRFMENGFEEGFGLMMSLGPGFSLEMSLLSVGIE